MYLGKGIDATRHGMFTVFTLNKYNYLREKIVGKKCTILITQTLVDLKET